MLWIPAGGLNISPRVRTLIFFAEPLNAPKETLIVPSVCLYEVFKNIFRQYGREQALEKVAVMRQCVVVPLGDEQALEAALISLEFNLPMADSIIMAAAQAYNATVWTQDAHFEHLSNVRYCAKSSG